VGDETDAELLKRLRRAPGRQVDLIVTVAGDPRGYESRVQAFDLEVKRAFSLTQKLALSGPARAFIALSREHWVLRMEEDRPVRTAD